MTPEEALAKAHDFANKGLISGTAWNFAGDWAPGVSFWEPLRIIRLATQCSAAVVPQNWTGEYWTIDGTTAVGQNVRLFFGLDAPGIVMENAWLDNGGVGR
jgi:hypothetical protein